MTDDSRDEFGRIMDNVSLCMPASLHSVRITESVERKIYEYELI